MSKSPHIKQVLVVYKKTILQEYLNRLGRMKGKPSAQLVKSLIRELTPSHKQHRDSIQHVKAVLKKYKMKTIFKSRRHGGVAGAFDLVISVGGDGTFLRTAHGLKHEPILGVNSVPTQSVGALCTVHASEFEAKLGAFLKGRAQIFKLNRLEIQVNGKKLPYFGVNDVLIANQSPAGTSRYQLKIGSYIEEQKSSGLWVSTAAGSTAAIQAAGGQVLPRSSYAIQYLVREPYAGDKKHLQNTQGILKAGSVIHVLIKMLSAALYIDGPQGEIPLQYGDKISIQNSPIPLRVIG